MKESTKTAITQCNAPLFGQWIGKFEGGSLIPGTPAYVFPGSATFNMEADRPNRGFACIDQGNQIHGSRKDFELNFQGNQFTGKAILTSSFDWQANETISVEESVQRQTKQGKDIFYLTELELQGGFIDQKKVTCNWSGSHKGIGMKG